GNAKRVQQYTGLQLLDNVRLKMAYTLVHSGGRSISWKGAFETVCDMDVASEPPWMGSRRVSKAPFQDVDRATKSCTKPQSKRHSFACFNPPRCLPPQGCGGAYCMRY